MSSIIRSKSSYFSAYTVMLRDRYEVDKYRRAMTSKWVQNIPKDALPVEDVENFDHRYEEECCKKKALSQSSTTKASPKKQLRPIRTIPEILSSNLTKPRQYPVYKTPEHEAKKSVEKSRSKKIKELSQTAKRNIGGEELRKAVIKKISNKIKSNQTVKHKIPGQEVKKGVEKCIPNKTKKPIPPAKLKEPGEEQKKTSEKPLPNKINKVSQHAKQKVSENELEKATGRIKSAVNNMSRKMYKPIVAEQNYFETAKRVYSNKTNKPYQFTRFNITEEELEKAVEKILSYKTNKPNQTAKYNLTDRNLEEAVEKILSNMQNNVNQSVKYKVTGNDLPKGVGKILSNRQNNVSQFDNYNVTGKNLTQGVEKHFSNKQNNVCQFVKYNIIGKDLAQGVQKNPSMVKGKSKPHVKAQRKPKKVLNKQQIEFMRKLQAYEKSVLFEAMKTLQESIPSTSTLQSNKLDTLKCGYKAIPSPKLEASQQFERVIDQQTLNGLLQQEALCSKSKHKSLAKQKLNYVDILERRNLGLDGNHAPYKQSYKKYDLLTKPSINPKLSEVSSARLYEKYINSKKDASEDDGSPFINCDESDKLVETLIHLKNMNSRHLSERAEAIRKTFSLSKNIVYNPVTRQTYHKLLPSKVSPYSKSSRKERSLLPPLWVGKRASCIRKKAKSSSSRSEMDQRFYNMGAAYMKALLAGRAAQKLSQSAQRSHVVKKTRTETNLRRHIHPR
ncbi:uncharacterized protein LOC119690167 [Teleopsis dalmanni]|uniref:uncharacterized protein LOC119690167 n=1 Tax=Teleopsis dalmanni TaxID=139649 RepID=UPI0018CCB07C|nr:uncharacterized protein LOC119690167 [Teleopsis dalmanni]